MVTKERLIQSKREFKMTVSLIDKMHLQEVEILISWHLNKDDLQSNFKVKAIKMKVVVRIVVIRVVVEIVVRVWSVMRKVEKIMVV